MCYRRCVIAVLLGSVIFVDLGGSCAKFGAAEPMFKIQASATNGRRKASKRKNSLGSKLATSPSRSLAVAGNCSAAGDSVFVNSTIEHISGCYVNTDEDSSFALPIFVKDASAIEDGSSVLFFSQEGSSYPASNTSSADLDGPYTWSLWRLDNASQETWETNSATCSTDAAEVGMDPTDTRLLGTWTCSYDTGGVYNSLPADFDGVECEPGCNTLRIVTASDNDDSDDQFDQRVGTILYAIFVIAAIVLLTAGIIYFCRRIAPAS